MRRNTLALFLFLAIFTVACVCPVTELINRLVEEKFNAYSTSLVTTYTTMPAISGPSATLEATATPIPPEDLLETAQAVGSPSPTAGGFAGTQPAGGAPGAAETPAGEGAPPDIPLVDKTEKFFASPDLVSYLTPIAYPDVLEFYKSAMPMNGWKRVGASAVEFEDMAILMYQKLNRTATVNLTPMEDGKTTVLIQIEVAE